jgi:hypothetical protein
VTGRWRRGEVIVRRERLGLQPPEVVASPPVTGVWLGVPVFVVEDSPDQLVTYIAPGAEMGFVPGEWPTPDGRHPWYGRGAWSGHGCLMVQRPGHHHAIWHFWTEPRRRFVCWYLNLQTAFVRTSLGYDTQDLELDIVVNADGSTVLKDEELLDQRIADGRWSPELVGWIRSYGATLWERLRSDGMWWDPSWADWTPPPEWTRMSQWCSSVTTR